MASHAYERTHPWVKFAVDLRPVPHELWMLLGEARSKCEHIAGVPLRPFDAKKLYEVYLTKGVHATTSIEGNTLSEEEVQERVKGKLKLPKSRAYLGQEVDNIVNACNEIMRTVIKKPDVPMDRERIGRFNATVLDGLETDEDTVPGQFRRHSVGVGGYRGAPAEDCPHLVDRLCDWLNGPDFRSTESNLNFALTVIKAVVAHVYFAWIHPFGDGNGRTARLIEYQLLVQSGSVPIPSGHLLSNHYNKTRSRYYQELDRASQSGGDLIPFLSYAVQGFVDGLREQLDYIRERQFSDLWVNYVHDAFRDEDTPANRRRKHLLLDMPTGPVNRSAIARMTPRVAADYATKGEKTLTRDLNALVERGLLKREGRAYLADRDIIRAFLPPQIPT